MASSTTITSFFFGPLCSATYFTLSLPKNNIEVYRKLTGLEVPDTADISEYGDIIYGRWRGSSELDEELFEDVLEFEPDTHELENKEGYSSRKEYRNGSTTLRFEQPELSWKRPEITFISDNGHDRPEYSKLESYINSTI